MAHPTDQTSPTPGPPPGFEWNESARRPGAWSPSSASQNDSLDEPGERYCPAWGGDYCLSHDEAADDDCGPNLWSTKH